MAASKALISVQEVSPDDDRLYTVPYTAIENVENNSQLDVQLEDAFKAVAPELHEMLVDVHINGFTRSDVKQFTGPLLDKAIVAFVKVTNYSTF